MSRAVARFSLGAAVVAWAAAAWTSGCAGALFMAPPNSEILLTANPEFVAASGGASVVTAVVIEPAGTYVPDGTVVLFFTDLGTIEREGRTRNGAARVNFVSDSRSGIAHISAVSGGAIPSATAPPSGTPTPPSSPTPRPSPTATGPRVVTGPPGQALGAAAGVTTASSGAAAARATATINITVGNANVASIQVRADPPRITISNSTHVIATVRDANGNPVANVPVYFYADSTPGTADLDPSLEFMDSAGRPVFTNQNGEAEDVMRTRRTTQGAARVQAVVAGGTSLLTSDVTIPIL